MHVTLNYKILAPLTFLALALLGVRALDGGTGSSGSELAAQAPESEHLQCQLVPASLCGLDVYPAGELLIVEPSFG